VANHASGLDALVILAASPKSLRFLVAPWIFNHPVFSFALKSLGYFKISRGELGKAGELSSIIARSLGAEQVLVAFPEGGLETNPGIRKFHLGVFQIASELGLKVQMLALKQTRQRQPWPNLFSQAGDLGVVFGPVMELEGLALKELHKEAESTRQWLSRQVGEPLLEERLRRGG